MAMINSLGVVAGLLGIGRLSIEVVPYLSRSEDRCLQMVASLLVQENVIIFFVVCQESELGELELGIHPRVPLHKFDEAAQC